MPAEKHPQINYPKKYWDTKPAGRDYEPNHNSQMPQIEFLSNKQELNDAEPLVVVIPGAYHNAQTMEPVLAALGNEGIQALALSIPGTGESSFGAETGSYSALTKIVSEFIKAQYSGQNIVIAAHSLGAPIALGVVQNILMEAQQSETHIPEIEMVLMSPAQIGRRLGYLLFFLQMSITFMKLLIENGFRVDFNKSTFTSEEIVRDQLLGEDAEDEVVQWLLNLTKGGTAPIKEITSSILKLDKEQLSLLDNVPATILQADKDKIVGMINRAILGAYTEILGEVEYQILADQPHDFFLTKEGQAKLTTAISDRLRNMSRSEITEA